MLAVTGTIEALAKLCPKVTFIHNISFWNKTQSINANILHLGLKNQYFALFLSYTNVKNSIAKMKKMETRFISRHEKKNLEEYSF